MADIYVRDKNTGQIIPFPAGTSREDIERAMRARAPTPSRPSPTATPAEQMGWIESAGHGLMDPVVGGLQLSRHVTGWPASYTDEYVRQREADLQRRGISSIPRFAGEVVPTMIGAAFAPEALAGAATVGGISAALQPVTGNNFVTEKALQTALGAAGGKILEGAGRFATRSRPATAAETRAEANTLKAKADEEFEKSGLPKSQQPDFRATNKNWDRAQQLLVASARAERRFKRAEEVSPLLPPGFQRMTEVLAHKAGMPAKVLKGIIDIFVDTSQPAALRNEAQKILEDTGLRLSRGNWWLQTAGGWSPVVGTAAGDALRQDRGADALR